MRHHLILCLLIAIPAEAETEHLTASETHSFVEAATAAKMAPSLDPTSFAGAIVRYTHDDGTVFEVDVADLLFTTVAHRVPGAEALTDFNAVCVIHEDRSNRPSTGPGRRDVNRDLVKRTVVCNASASVKSANDTITVTTALDGGRVPGPKARIINWARTLVGQIGNQLGPAR
jgi:hypothetical protein